RCPDRASAQQYVCLVCPPSTGQGGRLPIGVSVLFGALTFVFSQQFFPQTDADGGYFHQLVVFDKFQCLFQGVAYRRGQYNGFVGAGSTHVGQLLGLGRVYHQVIVAAVQTNNHAFIHFGLRTDEQTTAFLQSVQGITQCLTAYHGHQYTVVTGRGQAGLNRTVVI